MRKWALCVIFRVVALLSLWTLTLSVVRAQQAAPRSVKDGVYTLVQAKQGKVVYEEHCLECHGSMASATPDMAPLLNDYVFQGSWKDRSLGDLFDKIRNTMPPNKAGTVSPQQLIDLVAYILSANALKAGDVPLTDDPETLKQIRLDAGPP
jgi:mono/diheme cytochrome c family protein